MPNEEVSHYLIIINRFYIIVIVKYDELKMICICMFPYTPVVKLWQI